ncbi:hypothetical protein GP486_006964 [Trichoglossum hirsutum]|uniref:Flo11 n=1 Tax=Trichoglossum hirsutum TaxID=265104 RepID=A0A9P8L375_9PEZI|nr:hypothetical protein GP486_006964 [Trichoglossum hirsutum]
MPRSRSQSGGSDRPTLTGFSVLVSPPTFVNPEPAYIAASAASQIVTSDHEVNQADWPEDSVEPSGETALVSPESLKLINSFLDQLLYNFLSIARSTSLVSLRPAVTEVLKPKLAREAISGADQELHEYLGGGDDEDYLNGQRGPETVGPWDLDRVWTRTRLRCMVYSSLGDMEEEDEDRYMRADSPDNNNNTTTTSTTTSAHFADGPGFVSPAVAIFLTSILEFIGEQALVVAGQAAYSRIQSKRNDPGEHGSAVVEEEMAERIVVEEHDTEKVAFNATLGRLWRTWRKRLRAPIGSFSRSYPHPYPTSSIASTSRRSSTTNIEGPGSSQVPSRDASIVGINTVVSEVTEEEIAANIPLPMHENDVEEIEVPGVAELRRLSLIDDDHLLHAGNAEGNPRHLSLVIFPSAYPESDTSATETGTPLSPSSGRKRSLSLPPPKILPLILPSGESLDEGAISLLLQAQEFVSAKETESYTFGDSVHVTDIEEVGGGEAEDEINVNNSSKESEREDSSWSSDGADEGREEPRGQVMSVVYADDPHGHEEDDDEEPEVMELQRVMVTEGMQSPSLVQTRSRDNSSTRSHSTRSASASIRRLAAEEATPTTTTTTTITTTATAATATAATAAAAASRDKQGTGEDQHAIGVARTSDSSVPDEDGANSSSTSSAEPQVTKSKQSNSRFVLGAPPAPRNLRRHENSIILTEKSTPPSAMPPSAAEHGAPPPLTPLREMVEAAVDTSDEASVSATQDASRSNPGGHSPKSTSSSLSNHSHSHHTSTSNSRTSDRKVPAGHMMDRAAVQRLNTPPHTPRDPTPLPSPTVRGRRSGSFGSKTQRPIHTSGSGTSHKLKGLIGWDAEKPPTRQRSDDEESIKAQSFEQLIRSDETIQYTLTPETVREIDDTPRPSTQRSTMSVTRMNGLRVNPPNESTLSKLLNSAASPQSPTLQQLPTSAPAPAPAPAPASASASAPAPAPASAPSQAPLPPPPPTPKAKQAFAKPSAPRDARTRQDSMKEMADFLRTTGPIGPDSTRNVGRASTSSRHGPVPAVTRNQVPQSPTALRPIISNRAASVTSSKVSSKSRLQARDASVPYGDTSSDLIDFIRQGPPRDNGQSPRIPRNIAPFRNTMDSDRLSTGGGSRSNDLIPTSPTSIVDSTSQSKAQSYSSYNSQSGLLGNSANVKGRPQLEGHQPPQRKRRRVRDPYAIDSDESDEDDDLMPTPKPKRQEESLIEFLNSVPPPPAQEMTSSVFDGVPKPEQKVVQKKGSAPSLMTRFVRANSQSTNSPVSASPTAGPTAAPMTRIPTGAPQLSLSSGVGRGSPLMGSSPFPGSAGSGSVRTQPVSGVSRVGPTYASHVNLERKGPVRSSSISSGTYQPRSGRAESSRSNDLADFLKNSGPPVTTSTYAPPAQTKSELGITKIFRKKKAVGYA